MYENIIKEFENYYKIIINYKTLDNNIIIDNLYKIIYNDNIIDNNIINNRKDFIIKGLLNYQDKNNKKINYIQYINPNIIYLFITLNKLMNDEIFINYTIILKCYKLIIYYNDVNNPTKFLIIYFRLLELIKKLNKKELIFTNNNIINKEDYNKDDIKYINPITIYCLYYIYKSNISNDLTNEIKILLKL